MDLNSQLAGRDEFWKDVKQELRSRDFEMNAAEERIRTIREFFEGKPDENLFYHQSPSQVAKAITEDGYRLFAPPAESGLRFQDYLETEFE